MLRGLEPITRGMGQGRLPRRGDIGAGLGRRGSLGGCGKGKNTIRGTKA